MRATSTFRQGKDGKYDPKAGPKGDSEEASNRDNFRVAPGATHVLMDEEGPGVITHIWLTFLGPEPQDWAKQRLGQPPGDAPAHLLGRRRAARRRGARRRLLRQLLRPAQRGRQPAGHRRGCRLLQLLLAHAVPQVGPDRDRQPERQADQPALLQYRLDQEGPLPEDTPYFHAQYRQEYPAQHGRDYVLLETKGKGHYVGTVLAVRTRSPAWFGEGDEKIYIDGEAKPSIWGTGTEDYFLSAWGLKKTSTPYFGVPYFDQWGIVGGHTSAYRWHLNDPIVFNTGIKVTIEHFGWIAPDENPDYKSTSWNEREDDYASVAFWYQTGEPTFTARAPHARERTLPSLERVIAYGRDSRRPGASRAGRGGYPAARPLRRSQLLYKPESAEGAWVEIPFEVKTKEPLRLLLNMTKSYDFGRYQASLDGVKLGEPVDLYSAEIAQRGSPPAGLLAGAGSLHAAAGVHRQESPVRRAFPGNRVGPPPRAPASRGRLRPRQEQGLEEEAELYR